MILGNQVSKRVYASEKSVSVHWLLILSGDSDLCCVGPIVKNYE